MFYYQYQIKLSISFNPALIRASSLLCTCLYPSLRLAYPHTEPNTSSSRFVSNTIHRTEIECVYLHNRKVQCRHKPFLLKIMTSHWRTMLGQSSNYAFDYATIMPTNMLNYGKLCSVPLCIHAVHRGSRNRAYTHGHALSIIFV